MFNKLALLAVSSALVLATGCTPDPVPIYAQPTFNKVGDMQCTPDPRQPVPQYPENLTHAVVPPEQEIVYLPPCCPPGFYIPGQDITDTPLTHVPDDEPLVCVPIPDEPDDDDDDNEPRRPNNPTGGPTNVTVGAGN